MTVRLTAGMIARSLLVAAPCGRGRAEPTPCPLREFVMGSRFQLTTILSAGGAQTAGSPIPSEVSWRGRRSSAPRASPRRRHRSPL